MTVLDTFYLLFKNDAKQTQTDVAALEKQIESLKDKGKKRSEQETKDLKEAVARHKELAKSLKETTDQQEKLGTSFVKTIEAAAAAGTSLFAFSAIKSGVKNVTDFNSALRVTAGILGQNGSALAAFAAAGEHAGGTQEGALGAYQSLFQYYSSKGLKTADPTQLLGALRKDLAQRGTPAGKALLLQQLGISDTGIIALAESSGTDYQRALAQGQAAALSPEQQAKLRDLKQAEVDATQELNRAFGTMGAELSGVIIPALHKFGEILHGITNVPGGSTALAVGGTIAGGYGAKWVAGAIGRALGLGGSAAAAGGLGATGIGLAAAGIAGGAWYLLGKEQDAIKSYFGKGKSSPGNQNAIDFWTSQGYSREQAAAWAAQEQSESSGNPRAYNQGHYGLYQWSEARRQKILAATGIDVATASAADQRKAAAWEAEQTGIAAQVKASGDAGSASDILTRQFERPYSGAALSSEATKRAILAGKLAFGSPAIGSFSSGSTRTNSVKTGDINVYTQATDANGIAAGLGSALQNQLRLTVSAWDDGVAR